MRIHERSAVTTLETISNVLQNIYEYSMSILLSVKTPNS